MVLTNLHNCTNFIPLATNFSDLIIWPYDMYIPSGSYPGTTSIDCEKMESAVGPFIFEIETKLLSQIHKKVDLSSPRVA